MIEKLLEGIKSVGESVVDVVDDALMYLTVKRAFSAVITIPLAAAVPIYGLASCGGEEEPGGEGDSDEDNCEPDRGSNHCGDSPFFGKYLYAIGGSYVCGLPIKFNSDCSASILSLIPNSTDYVISDQIVCDYDSMDVSCEVSNARGSVTDSWTWTFDQNVGVSSSYPCTNGLLDATCGYTALVEGRNGNLRPDGARAYMVLEEIIPIEDCGDLVRDFADNNGFTFEECTTPED